MNLNVRPAIALLLCMGMAACCPDPQCPAFETLAGAQWIPPKNVSDLVYESPVTGRQVIFKVHANAGTPTYKKDSHWAGEGCTASDCKVEGSMSATSVDTLGGQFREMYIRVMGVYNVDALYGEDLRYMLGDFSSGFSVGPSLQPYYLAANDQWEADSVVENYTIGAHTYGQVMIQTKKPDATVFIQKVYLAEGFGVVAFVGNGELFILK